MSGEHNPLFSDPALMRVTPQVASQPADGSPPRYGSAVAPEGTAFHTHAGGQAASYLRSLADAELTRNQATASAAVPHTPASQNQSALPQQPSPPQQLSYRRDAPAPQQPQLPSSCSGFQPPVADLLQLNVAALPSGLQSPMVAQQTEADDAASETSIDMEIMLDQLLASHICQPSVCEDRLERPRPVPGQVGRRQAGWEVLDRRFRREILAILHVFGLVA